MALLVSAPLASQGVTSHFLQPTLSTWAASSPLAGFTSGQFVGSEQADLVAFDAATSSVILIPSNGNGVPTGPATFPSTPTQQITSLVVADFDGDGRNDVLAVGEELTLGQGGSRLLLGSIAGLSAPMVLPQTIEDTSMTVAGDLDGDGIADILTLATDASGAQTLEVVTMAGGVFSVLGSQPVSSNPGTSLVLFGRQTLADMNGDGDLDLLLVERSTAGTVATVLMYPGSTGVTFGAPLSITLPPLSVGTQGDVTDAWMEDLNFDETPDILVVRTDTVSTTVSLITAQPAMTFSPVEVIVSKSAAFPTRFISGDFSGDFFPDILGLAEVSTGPSGSTFALELFIGHPIARWSDPLPTTFSTTATNMAIAWPPVDVDGDLDLDVLIAGQGAPGSGQNFAGLVQNEVLLSIGCPGPNLPFRPFLWAPRSYRGNSSWGVALVHPAGPSRLSLLGISTVLNGPPGICAPLISVNLTNGTLFALPIQTDPTGFTFFPLPLPSDSALKGLSVNFQWGVVDPILPGGHALTPNRQVIIW